MLIVLFLLMIGKIFIESRFLKEFVIFCKFFGKIIMLCVNKIWEI